ncbi:hypothetical protein FBU30_004216 [Linnemannia zychae]|nr:hypothetical protein FBU30_004216 [Linnemannia zychae]
MAALALMVSFTDAKLEKKPRDVVAAKSSSDAMMWPNKLWNQKHKNCKHKHHGKNKPSKHIPHHSGKNSTKPQKKCKVVTVVEFAPCTAANFNIQLEIRRIYESIGVCLVIAGVRLVIVETCLVNTGACLVNMETCLVITGACLVIAAARLVIVETCLVVAEARLDSTGCPHGFCQSPLGLMVVMLDSMVVWTDTERTLLSPFVVMNQGTIGETQHNTTHTAKYTHTPQSR